METTEIAVQNQLENRTVTRTGVTLTQDIARSIVQAILSGERYYSDKDRKVFIHVANSAGEVEEVVFSANTYDNWIKRETIVPDTPKTLKALIEEAREKRLAIQRKKNMKQRVLASERALDQLLALPIEYTRVDRVIKRDENGKLKEIKRLTSKDISAPLVTAKINGLKFALERLDPENYGDKSEVKHAHVIFSLADLRKHREEAKKAQQ